MNKSELVEALANEKNLTYKKSEEIVNIIFDSMSDTLTQGGRIEIRGFGSFSVHYRSPRIGRNPKTGDSVALYSGLHSHEQQRFDKNHYMYAVLCTSFNCKPL